MGNGIIAARRNRHSISQLLACVQNTKAARDYWQRVRQKVAHVIVLLKTKHLVYLLCAVSSRLQTVHEWGHEYPGGYSFSNLRRAMRLL
jgi:hypothetical protein